jgi:very-short-patch-repair endonuclease
VPRYVRFGVSSVPVVRRCGRSFAVHSVSVDRHVGGRRPHANRMDVMDRLDDIARANGGIVTRRAATEAGISDVVLRNCMRRGLVARVARGTYVAVSEPVCHADPAVITSLWRVVLSHESAAAWWGVDLHAPSPVMHVLAPRNRGRRTATVIDGVRLHRATIGNDACRLRGVAVTSPLRTVFDIARTASLEHAVATADSFLRAGLLSIEELLGAAHVLPAAPGRCRIQLAMSLVDPTSGSILESLARVLLWRNGLRPPTSQLKVLSRRGSLIGRFDFAWPEIRLILECDGLMFHSGREVFARDRRRWAALTRAGWRVVVVTWQDVVGDPAYVVGLVRELVNSGAQP